MDHPITVANRRRLLLAISVLLLAIASVLTIAFSFQGVFGQGNSCSLALTRKINLPNIQGRIDHIDVSAADEIAYVAARANNSLAVVDLRAGSFVRSVEGFRAPQGVLYIPRLKEVLVTNGGDGAVDVLDATSLVRIRSVQLTSNADNIRIDSGQLIVFVGYGEGGIAAISASTDEVLNEVALLGHPESFQLEKGGPRIFANVPTANYVAVLDRELKTVVARWPLPNDTSGSFAMSLDEANNRLFIGTRDPPSLLVLDSISGHTIARIAISGDPDDIYYDSKGCLYLSAGAGVVDVVKQLDANRYALVRSVATVPGARTSSFIPSMKQLLVAVPAGSGNSSLYVFSTYGA